MACCRSLFLGVEMKDDCSRVLIGWKFGTLDGYSVTYGATKKYGIHNRVAVRSFVVS